MALLQKKLSYQTKSKPSLLNIGCNQKKINNNKGFISLLFLPLVALMFTAFIGLSSLSLGIKNITQAQSSCIKMNMTGQNNLRLLLDQIIKLNAKVLLLHRMRQTLQTSLTAAIALSQVELIPSLKKALSVTKQGQKAVRLKQKKLLMQSQFIKINTFKKLKKEFKILSINKLRETTIHKKALALKKKKVGNQAYIYNTVSSFTDHQKSQYVWEMQPFFPLYDKSLVAGQKRLFSYRCTASLKKKGETWNSIIYH